jgi:hypothetical protein
MPAHLLVARPRLRRRLTGMIIMASASAWLFSAAPAVRASESPASTGVANPGQPTVQHPFRLGRTRFNNWSGFAAYNATFTKVTAQWVQPAVTCPTPDAWAVFWIGFDGFNNPTVEQVGTSARCVNGVPKYKSWWEMFPTNAITPVFDIRPGDSISATVSFKPTGKFVLKLNDITTGQSFKQTPRCAPNQTCSRSSAEWIAESPSHFGTGSLFPLAHFTPVTFTGSTATAGLHTGTISDPRWTDTAIDMVNSNNVTRATASPLDATGSRFTDTWKHK